MKAQVGTLNKEKALVGAFSRHCETLRRFVSSSIPGASLLLVSLPGDVALWLSLDWFVLAQVRGLGEQAGRHRVKMTRGQGRS